MKKAVGFVYAWVLVAGVLPGWLEADRVDTLWMRRYAQPGYCNDEATAMAVDAAGNVYVTGSSQRVEAGLKDYATVKYSPDGVQLWAERYSGPGNSVPSAITVDGAGNVYVTGASESTGTSWDYLTLKYNSSGVLQWSDRYNGAANGDDRAASVCVDSSGNAAVCGYTSGVSSSHDWAIIGYSPSGAHRFVTPRSSAGGNPDEANCIIADPEGNYYVAGRLWLASKMDDAVVTRYTSTGVEQWTASYDGPLSGDGAVALCRNAAGDLFATGWSVGLSDNADVLTMKVSAAGALLWTARYAAPENGSDIGLRIALDGTGNVRVLGRVQTGAGGSYDIVTLGYASDSTGQFTNRLNSGGYGQPGGLALDQDGNVLVCGSLAGDFLTLQYNGASEAWRRIEDFASGDAAAAVCVDDSGCVIVAGRGDFGANAWDFVTIKYDPKAGVGEEISRPQAASRKPEPTLVRGSLRLPTAVSGQRSAVSSLLDVSGRRVLGLKPGDNDVRHIPPGAYFIVTDHEPRTSRILITR